MIRVALFILTVLLPLVAEAQRYTTSLHRRPVTTTSTSTSSTTTTSTSTSSTTDPSATTSTSTSTTTTTTTLAGVVGDSVLALGYIGAENVGSFGAANRLQCGRLPARHGVANATKLAVAFTNGSTALTCGIAVYPDTDGGTVLLSHSGPCPLNATDVVSVTGLTPASLTADVTYRWCVCATSTVVTYLAPFARDRVSTLANAFETVNGYGANACVAGVPPSTTGALTATTTGMADIWVE